MRDRAENASSPAQAVREQSELKQRPRRFSAQRVANLGRSSAVWLGRLRADPYPREPS